MKDYLKNEGFNVKSPGQTIKESFKMEIIEDREAWMDAPIKKILQLILMIKVL